jgi:26S proteasome regulatory subunit N12
LADATTLLYFKTAEEVIAFSKERNWNVDPKSKIIYFANPSTLSQGSVRIPVDDVIHNVLSYAKELERIV